MSLVGVVTAVTSTSVAVDSTMNDVITSVPLAFPAESVTLIEQFE